MEVFPIARVIPIELKKKCCELKDSGMSNRTIYERYYAPVMGDTLSPDSFRSILSRWRRTEFPDEKTLEAGTYKGFTAHGATVQVDSKGEIVQAWIKQHADELTPEEFIEALRGKVEPFIFTPQEHDESRDMLEIPLFDMHWGVAFMEHYERTLNDILSLISQHHWCQIAIPFGQDFFHNDSIVNGQTTKGTAIEKVDMVRAVKDGQKFIYSIIDNAINNADHVSVMYSPGNHDRSISWMFMQTLLERYGPDVVDDTLEFRKIVTYGKNSIMITHGDAKKANPSNLAHTFPISFPNEFANANVREIHAGHLHHETDTDVYGIMVRRLSTGNKTDEWSDKEDFIGSHKRFMIFEWGEDKLRSIHYI